MFCECDHSRLCCRRRTRRGCLPTSWHGARVRERGPVRPHLRKGTSGPKGCQVPAGRNGQSECPSRRARIPGRTDRDGHALDVGTTRDSTATAGTRARSSPHEWACPGGRPKVLPRTNRLKPGEKKHKKPLPTTSHVKKTSV